MKFAKVIPVETEFGTYHVRRMGFGDMFKYRNALAAIKAGTLPDDEKDHAAILAILDCTVCDENGNKVGGFDANTLDSELAYKLYHAAIDVGTVTTEAVEAAKKD